MNVRELIDGHKAVFSFEFFPPKTEADTKALFNVIGELKTLQPDYVSVTHSATGAAPLKTAALARIIKENYGMEPIAHFTCIAHTRPEVRDIAKLLKEHGIRNVLALRGDRRPDAPPPPPNPYNYAAELVRDLNAEGGFCIGVAGYPEKHPEAPSLEADIARLREKVDAGASFIITQLFFNNADYFSFVDKCRAAGIAVPIVPGIMPVTSHKQLNRFSEMCGCVIPKPLAEDLERIKDMPEAVVEYGIDFAYRQCKELLDKGAPGLHFYTLNRSVSTMAVLRRLKNEGYGK